MHHNSSSSLGKSLQREKKKRELGSRAKFKTMLEKERMSALAAEAAQHERGTTQNTQLKSIWETNDLESFLDIADARENGYFAERDVRVIVDGRAHIVSGSKQTPQIMCNDCEDSDSDDSKSKENNTRGTDFTSHANRHHANKTKMDLLELSKKLTIPKRPRWTYEMHTEELQLAEQESFHEWRRELSKIEDEYNMLLTPFEKNLEVWRQLWRVVERANVVALILDARNPLIFRCADFERYVLEYNATQQAKKEQNNNNLNKNNINNSKAKNKLQNNNKSDKKIIYILNKADLLTDDQRKAWASYFESKNEIFYFFAAKPTTHTLSQNKEDNTAQKSIINCKYNTTEQIPLSKKQESKFNSNANSSQETLDQHTKHSSAVLEHESELEQLDKEVFTKEKMHFKKDINDNYNDLDAISNNSETNVNVTVKNTTNIEEEEQEQQEEEKEEQQEEEEEEESQYVGNQAKRNISRRRKKALRAPLNVINPYVLEEQRKQKKIEKMNACSVKNTTESMTLTKEEMMRDARIGSEYIQPVTTTTTTTTNNNNNNNNNISEENVMNSTIQPEQTTTTAAAAAVHKRESWHVLNPVELIDALALLRRDMNIHDLGTPLMVGLVGYPNVGKSSTINAILGAKKVTVSATPGKTKHFQTLPIPNERRVMLCDCPGLVFPSFASNRASMTCDGILPIDNATNTLEAIAVLCQRIPRVLLEYLFKINLTFPTPQFNWTAHALHEMDEYNKNIPELLLTAIARRRGYLVSHDRVNLARAGKELLKMYVDGNKLIYVEPPPTFRPSKHELATADESVNDNTHNNRINKLNKVQWTQDQELESEKVSNEWESDNKAAEVNIEHEQNANTNVVDDKLEWDSNDEEAWADLDSADENRALSDEEDNSNINNKTNNRTTTMWKGHYTRHMYTNKKEQLQYKYVRENICESNATDEDNINDEDHTPFFLLRPIQAYQRGCFTKRELFNLESNKLRIAECVESELAEMQRRRQRRSRKHHVNNIDNNENDEYTFVNKDGEVELKIDDDDGVVELVHALSLNATNSTVQKRHNRELEQQLECEELLLEQEEEKLECSYEVEKSNINNSKSNKQLTKRQRQRLLRKSGLDDKHANTFKNNMLHSFGTRKVEINGYM